MLKRLSVYMIIASVCFLAACSNTGKITELPTANISAPVDYKVGVGDELLVNVWRNPELSMDVPVRPDGKISLPLVGDVIAAGRTSQELSADLSTALSSYVRNPQVTVIVTTPSSSDFQRRVRITGAVNNQQSIPHRAGMTVLDLVLLAGGPNEFASPDKAKLFRTLDGGEVKIYPIYLNDLLKKGKLETNYILSPSDIVSIPERLF